MNVNKKTASIVAGAAGIILGVSGCSTSDYEYDISGDVIGQQLDYDCPKGSKNLAIDLVAFEAGKRPGGSAKKSSDNDSSSSDSDSSGSNFSSKTKTATPKPVKSSPSANSKTGQSTGTNKSSPSPAKKTSTPTPKKTPNKGVKLSKKPDSPDRLNKTRTLPKAKYKYKPKGCKTEYEIFVVASDGYTYEQDVRSEDYRACEQAKVPAGKKYKLFPLCTKG